MVISSFLRGRDFGSSMLARLNELERKSGTRFETTQKVLLAETGTLEQILSILAQEDTVVKILEQVECNGTISRKSTITTSSGRPLVKARSKIFVRNIPAKAARLLRSQKLGIGSIIQKLELETFRKITHIGYDPLSGNLFRKYRIIVNGRVAFEIREEFVK